MNRKKSLIEKEFDVLIVGAGPAGTAAAFALARSGLAIALLDKANFPRDKICGDALSVDVINQLSILSPALADKFASLAKTASFGVTIYSPDRNHIDIPFVHRNEKCCGYICPRFDFDNFLFDQLKQFSTIKIFESCSVDNVERQEENILVHTSQGTFKGKIVIGADGAHSVVSKKLTQAKIDKDHHSAGLRMYYDNVHALHAEGFIELHFFQEILPGYLWIFPLPDKKANVGIGMLSSAVSKKKINLKEVLHRLVTSHPDLKERFQDAKPLETVKGYGLPLGSKKRILSGERFLLTGDAAALIDPFTGEGIANAIRSGRIAGAHVIECFKKNNFSAAINAQYDAEIYRRMWPELRLSRTLQQLCRYPWLFNFVVRKAKQSKHVHQRLVNALADVKKKKSLVNPSFYFRLLFNKK